MTTNLKSKLEQEDTLDGWAIEISDATQPEESGETDMAILAAENEGMQCRPNMLLMRADRRRDDDHEKRVAA